MYSLYSKQPCICRPNFAEECHCKEKCELCGGQVVFINYGTDSGRVKYGYWQCANYGTDNLWQKLFGPKHYRLEYGCDGQG